MTEKFWKIGLLNLADSEIERNALSKETRLGVFDPIFFCWLPSAICPFSGYLLQSIVTNGMRLFHAERSNPQECLCLLFQTYRNESASRSTMDETTDILHRMVNRHRLLAFRISMPARRIKWWAPISSFCHHRPFLQCRNLILIPPVFACVAFSEDLFFLFSFHVSKPQAFRSLCNVNDLDHCISMMIKHYYYISYSRLESKIVYLILF